LLLQLRYIHAIVLFQIVFDNHEINGQIPVSLKTQTTEIPCQGDGFTGDKKGNIAKMHLIIMINCLIMQNQVFFH